MNANTKTTVRDIERNLMRKRRLFSKHRWVAMGEDIDGAWVEVFYSSKRKREAMRCVSALTEQRTCCKVMSVNRV
jgi:uncharacterized DUF497 family protein